MTLICPGRPREALQDRQREDDAAVLQRDPGAVDPGDLQAPSLDRQVPADADVERRSRRRRRPSPATRVRRARHHDQAPREEALQLRAEHEDRRAGGDRVRHDLNRGCRGDARNAVDAPDDRGGQGGDGEVADPRLEDAEVGAPELREIAGRARDTAGQRQQGDGRRDAERDAEAGQRGAPPAAPEVGAHHRDHRRRLRGIARTSSSARARRWGVTVLPQPFAAAGGAAPAASGAYARRSANQAAASSPTSSSAPGCVNR